MAVLKDIRGLLSATREAPAAEPASKPGPDLNAEKAALEEKVRQYEEAALKHQAAIERLEAEKKQLEGKLRELQAGVSKGGKAPPPPRPLSPSASPQPDARKIALDISDLEARKAELSQALSEIEDLVQIKVKDLARRIARVYEEAGDIGASRDFRRITSQLEASENFGEFIRALTRE
jgi:DNA repair exonuclease SbcCD ATPase subunit